MASPAQTLKAAIRKAANAIGYDIVGYDGNNPRRRLAGLLARHRIHVILDVGANEGHFGWDMRELGYRDRIVSFEPMTDAFRRLQTAAAGDSAWQAVQCGLGAQDEQRAINIAANSQSSSFLPMLEAHREAAPESAYKAREQVMVRRLDGLFADYCKPGESAFLKIDTQGFERQVLDGAGPVLGQVPLLQLECSLVPLYEGADTMEELVGLARELGYAPIDILPTFHHKDSGHLMQADILFVRA
jgi:FkbM family methyltransferase